MKRGWVKPLIALLLIAAGIVAARALGLGDLIRLENVARLKQWIEGYGALAPAIYVAGYILATVFFVPGLAVTVLGGAPSTLIVTTAFGSPVPVSAGSEVTPSLADPPVSCASPTVTAGGVVSIVTARPNELVLTLPPVSRCVATSVCTPSDSTLVVTDQVPEEFRGPNGTFRYKRIDARQDPLSHHAVVLPYTGSTPIKDPIWGPYTCGGGANPPNSRSISSAKAIVVRSSR
jgi:hypothetical protein